MVYLNVKRVGNKKYYSLKDSIRKENKVISRYICSLGKDLSKVDLKRIKKYYKIKKYGSSLKKSLEVYSNIEEAKKIKSKKDMFFDKEQLDNINAILVHFRIKFAKYEEKSRKESTNKFNMNFIAENVSMESNVISSEKVEKLVKNNLISKNMSFSDVNSIINNKKLLEFLENKKPSVNLKLIKKIHNIIYSMYKIKDYRKYEIKINKNKFNPSASENIESDLKELLKWFKNNKNKMHTLALIILFHHKFEKIHPFIGKNGETGRILMNYMLSEFGYPPIIISRKLKEEYYEVMDKAYPCLKKDLLNTDMRYYKPLIDFMQKQFVKTYWNNFLINN